MENRQENLLKCIVEEYVQTATPVGSGLMVEKYFPDLSSATIRNEMAELEDAGLICQPYTSAGRVPTVSGYRYYVDKFLEDNGLLAEDLRELEPLEISADREDVKKLAKKIAELSEATVLIGFNPHDVYYTGISNLFRQPEFAQASLLYSMSSVIDGLDLVMGRVFCEIGSEPKILIGDENPFGEMSSVVLIKVEQAVAPLMFGILGPNRMDYGRNLALAKFAKSLLSKTI